MQQAPIPDDEATRLALLRACNIMHTPAEQAFDDVARLAAEICDVEIALITLVDSDYQWFKARVGVELEGTPRNLSFCAHCINHHDPLVVADTHADARFADNPLVTGEPGIRFYAGVPLLVEAGSAVGALSIASRVPRVITPKQMESLQRLARQVARELRLRRDLERAGGTLSGADMPVAPGALLAGRFRVTRLLGKGGAGSVFEAIDASGERVAIKVLLPEWRANEQIVERFAREARVLMRLTTPHVGKLIEVGNLSAAQGGLPFLALEYLDGMDLARFIESKRAVSVTEACGWCADACDGLSEAHSLGVIHRDLKPSNIFLATRDGAMIAKVLDFGIAAGDPLSSAPSHITNTEGIIGSPSYMAPEQMLSASDVDPRSDVWSMGAVLYELLTGKQAFRGESFLQIFASVMTKPPAPLRAVRPTGISGELEAVALRCLRRERGERFESMGALASALRDAAGIEPAA